MRASAPASSANLGPGFDALALALELRCEVSVEASSEWEISDDPDGFIEGAARRISTQPLRVAVTSAIPIGKGLGSSAALLASLEASVRRHEGVEVDLDELFKSVTAAEGHSDNAAAAVYGGLVLARAGGVHPLEIHPSLSVVVAVPREALSTLEARRALPDTVPFEVAARTAGRSIRLVEGLRTGDQTLLGSIGLDELHEPSRISLRPIIGTLLEVAIRAGAPFASISGSGPSVIAVVETSSAPSVREALAAEECLVLSPAIAADGVR